VQQVVVEIIKLAWIGTRTENAGPTVAFFRDVLGLRLERDEPDFGKMTLPDGSKVEVFGPGSDMNRHFTTGPVAGFPGPVAAMIRGRGRGRKTKSLRSGALPLLISLIPSRR
jgi:catechol 2,3-dioxygenase-like lactoylglutathione lyase family enzyme